MATIDPALKAMLDGCWVDKEMVLALLGGIWPEAEGFDWQQVDHFQILFAGLKPTPGTIQGFDGSGEPIGPTIEYQIRVLTNAEEIQSVQ